MRVTGKLQILNQVYLIKLKVTLGDRYRMFNTQFFQHCAMFGIFHNKIVGKKMKIAWENIDRLYMETVKETRSHKFFNKILITGQNKQEEIICIAFKPVG